MSNMPRLCDSSVVVVVATAAAECLSELQQVHVYWMTFNLSPQLDDLPIQPPAKVRTPQPRYF